jgi:hypothetical protein
MNKKQFKFVIASDCEKENLIVEIYYENDLWASITKKQAQFIIRFYCPSKGTYWIIPFEAATKALEHAKYKLLD